MFKIELIESEQKKFFNFLANTYAQQDNNIDIKDFIGKYKKDDKKYLIYPSYGKFKWKYNDDIFEIQYFQEGGPLATSDYIDYFMRLYIYGEDITKLQNFLGYAFNYVSEIEDSSKVKLYISRCSQYGSSWDSFDTINVQTIENIFIDKKIKENIISHIDNFINLKDKYIKFGRTHKLNILFTGIPGSGKTSLCKALAKKYNYDIYIMNFNKTMTDTAMIDLISNVQKNSIILYEDIDVFFSNRESQDINVSFSTLINILDGTLSKGSGIINIITTNYPDKLDSALLRPGRIDKLITFDYPKKDEIKEAFIALIGSNNNFEDFFSNIKNSKITMSGIINYLFSHSEDYLDKDNITELLKQINFIHNITKDIDNTKLYL
jgi:hypothetical protein